MKQRGRCLKEKSGDLGNFKAKGFENSGNSEKTQRMQIGSLKVKKEFK